MDWGSNNFGAPGNTGNRMPFRSRGFGTNSYKPQRQYQTGMQMQRPQPAPAPQYGQSVPQTRPQPLPQYRPTMPQQTAPQTASQQSPAALYNQGRTIPQASGELMANPYLRPGEYGTQVMKTRDEWDKQEQDWQNTLRENAAYRPQYRDNGYPNSPWLGSTFEPQNRIASFGEERRRM